MSKHLEENENDRQFQPTDHDDDDDEREDNANEEKLEAERKLVPMFEKTLTPSDLGKLNRLVIPKQHALRFFPMLSGKKVMTTMLSFEDEKGQSWRFRYSYWTSSQSYVLTKGWSRFVRQKQLDAGDVVFFEHLPSSEINYFFIGWKRRSAMAVMTLIDPEEASRRRQSSHHRPGSTTTSAGTSREGQKSVVRYSKRLRLFGVNLECQPDESKRQN